MSSRGPLTRRDFDEVMRRAAELAADDPDGAADAFSDAEVVRIGREVGLPERHVRRALAERRASGGGVGSGGWRDAVAMVLLRDEVKASRTIARSRARIRRELDDFMVGGQLLQRVRGKDDLLQYRPAVDWASRVARAASFRSRKHYVASARLVEIRMERIEKESTQVEVRVDPGIASNYRNWWVVVGLVMGFAVGGVGVGAGWSLPLVVGVSAVVGASAPLLTAMLAAPGFRRRVADVRTEVEGVLDGLETKNGLEPPPPAWRRWVRRHFHGVAREMMDSQHGESNWRSKK